ncbi:MAG: type II toxin-antitoxin system HicB family antitoxin [Spirochaetia bacterium]
MRTFFVDRRECQGRGYHDQPVLLQPDEIGGYVAECPLLEGCYSQGDTVDEVLTNIREAIELCLKDIEERRHPAAGSEFS